MTDLITRLTLARPTETDSTELWAPTARAELLARVLTPAARRRPGRRTSAVAAAAGLVAVGLMAPVLDSGSAAAADLQDLARSAVTYDQTAPAPGTWIHEKTISLQRNSPAVGNGAVYDDRLETWTSWDGQVLRIDHRPSAGRTEYDIITDTAPASFQNPTAAYAATLPDDADGLLANLAPRVFGSSSHDEAMYGALVQLRAPTPFPHAPLQPCSRPWPASTTSRPPTPPSTVGPRSRSAMTRSRTSSTETVVFDRATGQSFSTHQSSEQSDYTSTTTLAEVVDQVPAEVLTAFRAHQREARDTRP